MHQAIVRLDAPGIQHHHDWDNMGQRATVSQTITYTDVFIPDGWHSPMAAPSGIFIAFGMTLHGALLSGIGQGGFDAMLQYVQATNRTILPGFKSGGEDPLMRIHAGKFSTRLAAAD